MKIPNRFIPYSDSPLTSFIFSIANFLSSLSSDPKRDRVSMPPPSLQHFLHHRLHLHRAVHPYKLDSLKYGDGTLENVRPALYVKPHYRINNNNVAENNLEIFIAETVPS